MENLTTVNELTQHVIEKHQVDGLLHCRLCERTYDTYTALKMHVRNVHPPAYVSCDKCPKMFSTKQGLTIHYICHQKEYPFQCETCGRKFKRKVVFEGHMKKFHRADRGDEKMQRYERIAYSFAKAVVCKSDFYKSATNQLA